MPSRTPSAKVPTTVDPYPAFTKDQKTWFMCLIEGLVTKPESANCARIKAGLDMEIMISVAREDEHIFTAERCRKLQAMLAWMAGVPAPVVYLIDNPHPEAAEALRYAAEQC